MIKKLTTNKIIFSTPKKRKMAINPKLAKNLTPTAPNMIFTEFSLFKFTK